MELRTTTESSPQRRAIAQLVTAMIVADRRVTTGEVDVATRLDRIGLGPLGTIVREDLRRATTMPIDIDGACSRLAGAGATLIGTVLSVLAEVAASDGAIDADESRVFDAVAHRLGTRMRDVRDWIEDGAGAAAEAVAAGTAERWDDPALALRALGLPESASRADIDAAFVRLVEQYDPAKIAPLGAEFVALAIRKLAVLRDQYETARRAATA
jgi:hypothetical protein